MRKGGDGPAEAAAILDDQIRQLRRLAHDELVRYLDPAAFERPAASGRMYQVEVSALWDDPKRRHLRVIVAVDDGTGVRLSDHLRDNFIIAPDDSFIGEA